MSNPKNGTPSGSKQIKVTVPLEVAAYYEGLAVRSGGSVSGAMSPVLCAMARGEITQGGFTQQPGTDLRPW